MDRRIEAHKRTINRVKWHPLEHHMVATASQDGTLKIWDRRARSRAAAGGHEAAAVTITPAAGAIRDVTFCHEGSKAACSGSFTKPLVLRSDALTEMKWIPSIGFRTTA